MQNEDDDDPIASAAWAETNRNSAIAALPQELKDREDGIARKQRLQNASAVSKMRDVHALA